LADDRGRPVAFALTPGNIADVVMAVPLLGAVAKPKRLLADKAYDADSLRRWLKQRKIRAAIPFTASRRTPYPLDRAAYKRRNVIEHMFCKLKNWRRVATRRWLKQRKIRAAIPFTASRRTPYPLDRAAYKRRNVIERMFCKLKNWRRVATRYDRLARNYLSGLALAAIIIAWT
jgi:transposase